MVYPEPCYLHFQHKQILPIQISGFRYLKKKQEFRVVTSKSGYEVFS